MPGTNGRPAYSIGAGIALATFMGQRETDIIGARPQDFAAGTWKVLRSKRQTHGAIAPHRCAAPWVRLAGRQARRAAAPHDPARLLVYEGTGKPYSEDLFRRAFARVRAEAAKRCPSVADLQFRDLRRTAGHLARLGRASERDVADLLGNTAWKDPKLSGTYMPVTAETAARAVAAIRPPAGFPRAIRGAV